MSKILLGGGVKWKLIAVFLLQSGFLSKNGHPADRQTNRPTNRPIDRQTDRQVDTYLAYDDRGIGATAATAATDSCAAGAEAVPREEDQEEKQDHWNKMADIRKIETK